MPFNIGPGELILILIIALVVLGPGKLPDVAQSLGKSVREFRKAATDVTEAGKFDAPPATDPAVPTVPPPPAPDAPASMATPATMPPPAATSAMAPGVPAPGFPAEPPVGSGAAPGGDERPADPPRS
jgi:TatA/E family protein of Tat protein translocase